MHTVTYYYNKDIEMEELVINGKTHFAGNFWDNNGRSVYENMITICNTLGVEASFNTKEVPWNDNTSSFDYEGTVDDN